MSFDTLIVENRVQCVKGYVGMHALFFAVPTDAFVYGSETCAQAFVAASCCLQSWPGH